MPPLAWPAASYIPARRHGDLLFCSGVTGGVGKGKVKGPEDIAMARVAAADAACQQLAVIEDALGSLDAVDYIVRLTGYVACDDIFESCPEVVNGASEIFLAGFGTSGEHARSAIGVAALPRGATVEVEVIVAVLSAS
jgi:enamine deaminase RidA (YjgF/YER057c/UK114 family)